MNINQIRSEYEKDSEVSDYVGSKYSINGAAIVGQDPGITTLNEVRTALMFDDKKSSLYRYISTHILCKLNLKDDEVVVFNLIDLNLKTSIQKIANDKGYDFYELVDYLAEQSYQAFLAKLDKYSPKYLITLGKPVFLFLCKKSKKKLDFKEIFAKQIEISLKERPFILIPCVHMTTFNVYRQVYGEQDHRLERLANII